MDISERQWRRALMQKTRPPSPGHRPLPPEHTACPDKTDTPLAHRRRLTKPEDQPPPGQLHVEQCQLISLPKIGGPRGSLTFVEETRHIPFTIKRVYYLYDVPGGASRGGHAHKALQQFMLAIAGSFDVLISDGVHEDIVTLNRSYQGLYIPSMIWRELINFSTGSVCIVLASEFYDEADYIRSHDEFLAAAGRTGEGNRPPVMTTASLR